LAAGKAVVTYQAWIASRLNPRKDIVMSFALSRDTVALANRTGESGNLQWPRRGGGEGLTGSASTGKLTRGRGRLMSHVPIDARQPRVAQPHVDFAARRQRVADFVQK
jgi:hypothetical protein